MNKEIFALFAGSNRQDAEKRERHDGNGDMEAWYYQTEATTYAFARLKGAHGVRENIPANRTYFVCGGTGLFTIDGKDFEVGEGSIVQILKGSTYDFRSTGDGKIEVFLDVGFRLDLETIPK